LSELAVQWRANKKRLRSQQGRRHD